MLKCHVKLKPRIDLPNVYIDQNLLEHRIRSPLELLNTREDKHSSSSNHHRRRTAKAWS